MIAAATARLMRRLAPAALLLAAPVHAGTIPITLVIPSLAQITGLSDVVFNAVAVQSDAVSTQNVCVFSNGASHGYTVVASGSGSGAAFTLAGASGGTIPYSVGWSGAAGSAGTTSLTANTASATFLGAASALSCAGNSLTSTLKITIAAPDLQSMVAGRSYTGTLTLVITPG